MKIKPVFGQSFSGRGVHPGDGECEDDLDSYQELLSIRAAAKGPRRRERVLGVS